MLLPKPPCGLRSVPRKTQVAQSRPYSDLSQLNLTFDLVFDAVGKMTKSQRRKILKSGGKFVSVRGSAKFKPGDLALIRTLIEKGEMTTVVDRTYQLEEIREAHRYVQQFRKRGNVSVQVATSF